MNLYKMKENSNASSYPRTLYSIIVSVGLLAMFVTFASWFLLSYPISTAVRNYFYGVNGIGDMSSQASWQYTTPREVNSTENSTVDLQHLKSGDSEDENKKNAVEKPSEVRNDEKITPGVSWQNTAPSENSSSENATAAIKQEDEYIKKDKGKPSEVINNDNTTQADKNSQDFNQTKDAGTVVKEECDLFHGEWHYDESGPLYTNNSCPIITQMQNCQGNGRPDKGYESWRWRPSHCDLPRFDAKQFLELMSGKTLAFVGDSVARNQMESLLCILWQVEVPKNRGNRHMQRWYFRSKSVMIVRIWSSWLVNQTGGAFKDIPAGITKVFLDVPDETFMKYVPEFDVLVLSSGHWFAKQSVYIKNNEIVGTQLWSPPNGSHYPVNNIEALAIATETAIAALATHPNFTGIAILRSFSPDHYEGGAWNTGGSCTGKVEPLRPGQLVENGFTNVMHEKQVTGFGLGAKKQTNAAKLRLMDITEVFSYRQDGHPGPYRSIDPNKITKRGPDGRPPPQDCLHWCMPGPVDTWNELVLEIVRREHQK